MSDAPTMSSPDCFVSPKGARDTDGGSDGPTDRLSQWEAAFSRGLVASSRQGAFSGSWPAGHVHIVDSPAQPEPVPTGGLYAHQVLLFTHDHGPYEERIVHGPVLGDGYNRPGDLRIYSATTNADDHRCRWEGRNQFFSVMLDAGLMSKACRALDLDYAALEFLDRFPARDPLLERLVRQLGTELRRSAPSGGLYVGELMQTVAVHLAAKYTTKQSAPETYRGGLPGYRARRVKDYIEAHLAEEIRLEDLAEEAEMNPYYFARLFKRSVGHPPYRYVIKRRMAEARRLLKEKPEWNVYQVALAVGYESHSRFSQLFKRETGLTPTKYRKVARR